MSEKDLARRTVKRARAHVPAQATEPAQETAPKLAERTEQEAKPDAAWRGVGLNWNESDAKSALITVGGTILGGLLVVLMIGLSLAISRILKGSRGADVYLGIVTVFTSLSGLSAIVLSGRHMAKFEVSPAELSKMAAIIGEHDANALFGPLPRNKAWDRFYLLTYILVALLLALGLLILVGVAAGIK